MGAPARAGLLAGVDQTEELGGLLSRAEVEVDDDVPRIVHGAVHDVIDDSRALAKSGEAVERLLPDRVVGDGVLDAKSVHG